jgi:drug/metabolite transporter (DMT)-like permease
VVAMLFSTFLEGYRWTLPGVVGVALAVAGNFLVLRTKSTRG